MEELILRISKSTSLDPSAARGAVATVLSFLQEEAPKHDVDAAFAALPGADELASEVPATGGLAKGMGGGLIGLAIKLSSLGLSMADMQTLGREVFAYGREKAGEEKMGALVRAVPGLSDFV